MGDDTQVITTELLDESLRNFRALCFEQVRICRAIYRPELRERALMATEAAFVDCLAARRPRTVRKQPGEATAVIPSVPVRSVRPRRVRYRREADATPGSLTRPTF